MEMRSNDENRDACPTVSLSWVPAVARLACRLVSALLMLGLLITLAPGAAQASGNYRVFIESGSFTLLKDGQPCQSFDLTLIPENSFELNAQNPEYSTDWGPEYDVDRCGYMFRPMLEMAGEWSPTFVEPLPGEDPPPDFIMVNYRFVLQIRDCSGDSCVWADTNIRFTIKTDSLMDAGTDIEGNAITYTYDLNQGLDNFGFFEGEMSLKVATERLSL